MSSNPSSIHSLKRAPRSAINFALAPFSEVKFATDHRVIDVSGDGTSNQGIPVTAARDAAVGADATINGLTIFTRRAAAMGGYLALHTNPPLHGCTQLPIEFSHGLLDFCTATLFR